MPSLFARLDQAAQRPQEAVFAVPFTHQPMCRPADKNAPWIVDTTRPAATVPAILITRSVPRNIPDSYDNRSDHRPGVSLAADQIEIDGSWGLSLLIGDYLTRVEDARRWRIESTFVDDVGRTKSTVNRI